MEFTNLKNSNQRISKIGIGTNKVGGHNFFYNLDEEAGKNFVKAAIDQGVNLIDTADVYGQGRSEELIGEVLKEITVNRDELVIATKGGSEWTKGRKNNRPEYLRSALEASLQRLGLDYVDLYYIHWPDGETPIAEAVGELERLKAEGKIKAIGVSNFSIDQLKEADQVGTISAMQSGYNMFNRSVETDVLPYCVEHGISFIPYYPLASGLLTGKYTAITDFPEYDLRRKRFQGTNGQEKFAKVKQLKAEADPLGIPLAHLALAWLLAQDSVDAVIPGGKHPDQANSNVRAGEIKLTAEQLATIELILK